MRSDPKDVFMQDDTLHAFFSSLIRKASRSLRRLGFQPQHVYPLDSKQALFALTRSDNIFTECDGDVLFAPINWGGSHWVLVILDLRASKKILFVDPLGASAPDVLHTALMSCFLDADFVNFSQRVQFDGFHCGAWCVFLAEEYINFCCSADPWCFRITNPSLFWPGIVWR